MGEGDKHGRHTLHPFISPFFIPFAVLPLGIEVDGKDAPLLAGTQKSFQCKAYGSRPPAMITWWLKNERVDSRKTYTVGAAAPAELGTFGIF